MYIFNKIRSYFFTQKNSSNDQQDYFRYILATFHLIKICLLSIVARSTFLQLVSKK